jgi:hypothetical protein
MAAYQQALQQLYQTPLPGFIAERNRLAAELRARGDKAGAAEVARRRRPTASVWTVNQLYWHARDAFDEMLSSAARLRKGDLSATKAYRDAIANLRQRATATLRDAGYGTSVATLRRVAMTLAAIAAAGGFRPDPPGALATERDPPGFEAVGISAEPSEGEPAAAPRHDRAAQGKRPHEKYARQRTAEANAARTDREREQQRLQARLHAAKQAERKRRDVEQARRKSERHRLETALRAASTQVRRRERALAALEKRLRAADEAVGDARAVVEDLERQLAKLDEIR